ncbi:MAG: hypothetical protein A3B68_03770 [Candidatus Melainabacteria bacterium RIFCSPHIGHO2_02_FULL_34_12]|nr:MAG: hypothetical protein A3B68_03770 [Candidatus Melainabacteria bacterium RIFCSPHIGHO2_02_FULL_34_12]
MNQPMHEQEPKRLHSPLLEGNSKYNTNKKNPNNYSPDLKTDLKNERNNIKILFENNHSIETKSNEVIKINEITLLENIIKGSLVFILGTGGLLSLLEAAMIIRSIINRDFEFGNSLFNFLIAFLGTILSMIVCTCFLNLIKFIKFNYLNTEKQNIKIEELIKSILSKH